MKNNQVYLVLDGGSPVFASENLDDAKAYKESIIDDRTQEVLYENGIDTPDEKDIYEAAFVSGYENDSLKIKSVNLAGKKADDEIEVGDDTFSVDEIKNLLRKSSEENF